MGIGPYERVVGADDPVRPGPITQHLVGQGPCALPGNAMIDGRRGECTPPYGGVTRAAVCGPM